MAVNSSSLFPGHATRSVAAIPSPELFSRYHGGSELEFRFVGAQVLCSLIDRAGLRPDHRVVEVGSGIGRIALPLTNWLGPGGSYLGVEIVREGVDWCRENISAHHPNFRFVHLDIYNAHHNSTGKLDVVAAWDPVDIGRFDIAIFSSVFTHLLRAEAAFYLELVRELLDDGGVMYSTWFLVDGHARKAIAEGKALVAFACEVDGLHHLAKGEPTGAVGYDEYLARLLFERAGLKIIDLVRGSWCGHSPPDGQYQDLIIAARAS
jgi:SAM-dependent methyltransferase